MQNIFLHSEDGSYDVRQIDIFNAFQILIFFECEFVCNLNSLLFHLKF